MYPIVSHALAKVNLLLNITGKADDGYHKMQSIFAFLKDLYDELIFYPDKEFNEYSALIPGIEHNQITKAWHILKNHFTRHIPHLEIAKNIPICAGLGGGSSDAACFINSVFDFWKFSENIYFNSKSACSQLQGAILHKHFTLLPMLPAAPAQGGLLRRAHGSIHTRCTRSVAASRIS